jgi:hypothetical protein
MGCQQTSPMRPMGEILDISERYSKEKERQTEPTGMLGREERLSGTVVETQLMGCRQTTPTRPPGVILAIPEGLSEPLSIRFSSLSLSLSLSPSFDFLDNPLIQHRPGCVTHKSGFFLVAGLNLLLIFNVMIYYWFSWFLFGWREEESE